MNLVRLGILFIIWSQYFIAFAQQNIDDLIKTTELAKEDTSLVNNLLKISEFYLESDRPNALKYTYRAFQIAEKLGYRKGLSEANYYLGKLYFLDENYDFAMKYFMDACSIAEKEGLKNEMARDIGNMGLIYYRQGNYPKATEYIFRSLQICEADGNRKMAANSYNLLGHIYSKQNNLRESSKYYFKFLSISEELHDTVSIAIAYNNIGGNFSELGEFDKALEYYLKSLPLKIHLKQEKSIAFAYDNIGICYLEKGDYTRAYGNIMKAMELRQKIKNKLGIMYSYISIGQYYQKIQNLNFSLDYMLKAEALAKELNSKEELKRISESLYKIYEKKGDFKKALDAHKQFKALSDSLYNESNTRRITQLSMQYEFDKQQQKAEIEHIKEQEKIEAQIKSQKLINIFVTIALVLTGITFIVLWRSYRIKKRDNLLLAFKNQQITEQANSIMEKNEELLQQKEEIVAQTELLTATNKQLEKLSIVASRTDNAIIIANSRGDIEWVNDAFTRLYGYTLEEFIAIRGSNLRAGSLNPEIDNILNEVIGHHKSVVYTTQNMTKDGFKIWSQTTMTPILADNGDLQYIVVVDANITLIKLAEKEIAKQNKDITDSIRYASRIQAALQPAEKFMKAVIPQYFVINLPRDIVSGDFYWISYKNHKTILAAADCTGHGVPGAFMSVLGIASLREVVNYLRITDAAEIMSRLREKIIQSLHQRGREGEANDGIDMALCVFDFKNRTLQYSGANKSLFLVRGTHLYEYKPDSYPIGIHEFRNKPFTNHNIELEINDMLYIASDGYVDQFGGEAGKKFMVKRFKKLLVDISSHPVEEQKLIMENTFLKWKGSHQQVDDVLVLGIKIM